MPIETGSQILNYVGDKNLGLGSNAGIPAIDPKQNLDIINSTARDISLMNHATNIKLFDQKIKDRDNTLELLASGQISAGKIDPNDRKVYDAGKKKVSDNFYKMIQSGGLNNPTAVREYYDSVNDLKNIATWAQSRQLEFDKLNAEKSTQTLDEDIERFDGHIKKMKEQPFWNPIVPMQKAFNYDINEATSSYLGNPITGSSIGKGEPGTETTQWNTVTDKNGVVTNKTTTKTAPLRSAQLTRQVPKTGTGVTVKPDGSLSEISYTAEKYWDYDTIQTNVQEAYISSPKDRQTQIEWFQDVNAYPDAEKIRLLKAYNNRIAQYNQEREIEPIGTNPDGTPRYSNQVNYSQDPATGKILIQETPTSFMAKHTLASIDGNYVEKPKPEVDYKILDNNTRIRLEAMGNANALKIARENNATELTKKTWELMSQGAVRDKNGKWSKPATAVTTANNGGIVPYWENYVAPQIEGLKQNLSKQLGVSTSNIEGDILVQTDQVSGLGIAYFGETGKTIAEDTKVKLRFRNGNPIGIVLDGVFYDQNDINTKATRMQNSNLTNKTDAPIFDNIPQQPIDSGDGKLTDAQYFIKYGKGRK